MNDAPHAEPGALAFPGALAGVEGALSCPNGKNALGAPEVVGGAVAVALAVGVVVLDVVGDQVVQREAVVRDHEVHAVRRLPAGQARPVFIVMQKPETNPLPAGR